MEQTPPVFYRADDTDSLIQKLETFRAVISKADGTLIPLNKHTSDGRRLFIAARRVSAPSNESSDADDTFSGWTRMHLPMSGVAIIDVYVESKEHGLLPAAHMDWSLHGNEADGSGNMHQAIKTKNEHEKLARDLWDTGTALKTVPRYQKQNIGTLMIAASVPVLEAAGVDRFFMGVMLAPGESTFGRYGLREDDFFPDNLMTPLPLSKLSQHPQLSKVLQEFL